MAAWSVPGYTEVKVLGSGGFGRVVLARHDASQLQVAIKYLRRDLLDDPLFAEMFRSEAQALADLDDPNIVQFYQYVRSFDGAAIIMELVDGVSLRQILQRYGSTTVPGALAVLEGSLNGLAAAHRRGVVHRDYKPENVLVDELGMSKLTDFGLAVRTGRVPVPGGTLLYAAPEQLAGDPASPSSDVYSATATFYECVTGHPPFSGNAIELLRMHDSEPVPVDPLPEPLRPLVLKGMAKDAAGRPADAALLAAELRAIAADAYGPGWDERGRSHLAEAALLLAALWPSQAAPAAQGTVHVIATTHPAQAGSATDTSATGASSAGSTRPRSLIRRLGSAKLIAAIGIALVVVITGVVVVAVTSGRSGSHGSGLTGPETAYVTSSANSTVTPVNLTTGRAGRPIKVGSGPDAIAITPDGKTAYVVNEFDNTITPINLTTKTPGTPIKVGSGPDAIAITPDGKTAYVADGGSGTGDRITPVNLATNTPGTPITVGKGPDAIAVTPDGKTAYVANAGSGTGDTVTPVNLAANTPGTPITVGKGPDAIAVTPDGKTAYVANALSGTVTPINLATSTPASPIAVGQQPIGVAITPDGKTAYVTNYLSNTVTPISLSDEAAGTPIQVGASPGAIVITPDGKTAYVMGGGGEGNGMVTPVHLTTGTLGTATPVGGGYFAIAITR